MKSILKYSVIIYMIFAFTILSGQTPPGEAPDIALNPTVKYGVLENGLTYFIKKIETQDPKLEMGFLVRTGSYKEEAHELDFAHHIEHLAFRETKNFPKGLNQNSELLSSLDMDTYDVHAKTGGLLTYYFFWPKRENLKAIKTGVDWFRDIADGLDVSQSSTERERGVLLQEYLANEANQDVLIAESKLESQLFPCLNSYENFIAHNKSYPHQDVKDFYKKWYRPDQMAVYIVGNIKNIDDLEGIVKEKLSSLINSKEPLMERICNKEYYSNKPKFEIVFSKANLPTYLNPISIHLIYPDSETIEKINSLAGMKKKLKNELIARVLNLRFKVKEQVYNKISDKYAVHTYKSNNKHSGKPKSALKIVVNTGLNKEKDALKETVQIIKQLKEYGIRKDEMEKVKNIVVDKILTKNEESITYWSTEMMNHFAYGEVFSDQKNSKLKKYLENLTKEEVNATIDSVFSQIPDDIGMIFPKNYESELQIEQTTRKFIKKVLKESVVPFEVINGPNLILTNNEVAALKINQEHKARNGINGTREYRLENGIKLILKSLKSNPSDQIILKGFRPQGAASFPKEKLYSALYAPAVVSYAGVGKFSKFELSRFYKNTSSLKLGVKPYITFDEAGIKEKVSVDELETLLQIVYLYFTNPRQDKLAFKDWKKTYLKIALKGINPRNDLIDFMGQVTGDYSNLPQATKSISSIKSVNFEDAHKIYRSLFSNPEEFTFIITGDFEEDKILPMLKKYLGNLPGKNSPDLKRKWQVSFNKGPERHQLKPSKFYETINSYYALSFIKQRENSNWKEDIKLRLLGQVANRMLFKLRSEKALKLYYFSAGTYTNRIMDRNELTFLVNIHPNEFPIVKQSIAEYIETIKNGDISDNIFEEIMIHNQPYFLVKTLNSQANILEKLYYYYRYNEPFINPVEIHDFFESLTKQDIQKIAREYFRDKYLHEIQIENEELMN
ncbi:pitrilysin family protein [Salegentibacter sp. Hel_I_6]|uniref:M16 family metallopeptidase n=1 Tax=Salegentibacter sp. Hel_I_6 TaxID=1250278 RepID=UPI00055DFFB3|nr:insulinase family protein [Salegentibacter sp. Hel_I_6]